MSPFLHLYLKMGNFGMKETPTHKKLLLTLGTEASIETHDLADLELSGMSSFISSVTQLKLMTQLLLMAAEMLL